MALYSISFMGKPHKPVSYTPNSGIGPPYKPQTVEAASADEAAAAAKAWYAQDLAKNKAMNTPSFFLMEEDEVDSIMLAEVDEDGYDSHGGMVYNYETLELQVDFNALLQTMGFLDG